MTARRVLTVLAVLLLPLAVWLAVVGLLAAALYTVTIAALLLIEGWLLAENDRLRAAVAWETALTAVMADEIEAAHAENARLRVVRPLGHRTPWETTNAYDVVRQLRAHRDGDAT